MTVHGRDHNYRNSPVTVLVLCLTLIGASSALSYAARTSPDRLPSVLVSEKKPMEAKRGWTIRDVVEVRRIDGLAISEDGHQIAFIIKQSFVDSGDIRYGLYVAESGRPGAARKLVETAFLADLSAHPGTKLWTVRGEFGEGVQIYDIDKNGQWYPVVLSSDLASVGGDDGVLEGAFEPHETGVISYQWSPDGSALWYSRFRLRSASESEVLSDNGFVYDDRTMWSSTVKHYRGLLRAMELHVFNPSSKADQNLVAIPSDNVINDYLFLRNSGTAWMPDSRGIRYNVTTIKPDGGWEESVWTADIASGKSRSLAWPQSSMSSLAMAYSFIPVPSGDGYLAVVPKSGRKHLVQFMASGEISSDYGEVSYSTLGPKAWRDARNGSILVQVSYDDHDGLVNIPASKASPELVKITDHLSDCDFNLNADFGVCVRQSLALPPEIATVTPANGRIATLVRPNAEYDQIEPLRSEHAEWTNRYGGINDGYITYPRHYVAARSYPAIVVSHGHGARNTFADDTFQWEFPVQLFAELDYVVLSVNEPRDSNEAGDPTQFGKEVEEGVARTQFNIALNPVASMEAALESVVKRGIVDPSKTGIVGYSRGGEIVEYAMSQSKIFKAGAVGDSAAPADYYWAGGSRMARSMWRALYGGSPYSAKPNVLENYRRLAPAFRAHEFAGPLLHQMTATRTYLALELDAFLKDENIPTEIVFFPGESHVFWQPRHRAAAMQRNIDWFDYWLLGKRNRGTKMAQYDKWDEMARRWHNVREQRDSHTEKTTPSDTK